MTVYTKKEMISITELQRTLSLIINKLSRDDIEKMVVLKNNKPQAVLMDIDKFESLMELVEHSQIAEIISSRNDNKTVSFGKALKRLGVDEEDL